jgi:phospholipid transport system substrate-binding protein
MGVKRDRTARSRRRCSLALALAAFALVAAASAQGPLQAVSSILAQTSAIIESDAARNTKIASLQDVARQLLDTRTRGRRALGRELAEQPPELQEEFLLLFDELLVRAWLQRLLLFREPAFDYVGEELQGKRAFVRTRIVTSGDTYAIDYEMLRSEQRWLATDIQVEGISLLRNYRAQFRRLLRDQTFEEVLGRLRRKVDVLRDDEA